MTSVVKLHRGIGREGRLALLADPAFVYCGRRCWGWPASPWANPFKVGPDADAKACVERYAEWLATQPHLIAALPSLKGRRLGCWCVNWDGAGEPDRPCHAVLLARLAEAGWPLD
jgi:hypothetical protein